MSQRPRIIVALPDVAERVTFGEWLVAEGFDPALTTSAAAAMVEMHAHPYDLLIADAGFVLAEGLHACGRRRSQTTRTIIVGHSGESQARAERRGSMYIGRPAGRTMLVCMVAMAFVDQRITRRSERKPLNRFGAVVNSISTQIVDVSNEGLRLAIPHMRGAVPPPHFHIKIPAMGLSLAVKRQWAVAWPPQGRPEAVRVGVALTHGDGPAVSMWRSFVASVPSLAPPPHAPRPPRRN
jgi:hypothetical protein